MTETVGSHVTEIFQPRSFRALLGETPRGAGADAAWPLSVCAACRWLGACPLFQPFQVGAKKGVVRLKLERLTQSR